MVTQSNQLRQVAIDDSNRSCKLYNCKENGGEYHYLFQCIDVLYRIQELRVYQIQSNSNVRKFESQCDKLKTAYWNLLIDTITQRVSSRG